METPATKHLRSKGIPFEIMEYEHKHRGARFAAQAMGFPVAGTIKTLVVDLGPKGYALVLMPGDKNLDLKKLVRIFSLKRAAMADTGTAERLTGFLVGGISPFGTKSNLPVILEGSLMDLDKVAVNAGKRGAMLIMHPRDILLATGGDVLKLTKESVRSPDRVSLPN